MIWCAISHLRSFCFYVSSFNIHNHDRFVLCERSLHSTFSFLSPLYSFRHRKDEKYIASHTYDLYLFETTFAVIPPRAHRRTFSIHLFEQQTPLPACVRTSVGHSHTRARVSGPAETKPLNETRKMSTYTLTLTSAMSLAKNKNRSRRICFHFFLFIPRA